jgi:hypothetical protein
VFGQGARKIISERTRKALAAMKDRIERHGFAETRAGRRIRRLGNPKGAAHLKGRGNAEAVEVIQAKAEARADELAALVQEIKANGATTVRAIAAELNRQGIQSPRGGEWSPSSVHRLLGRI